MAVIGRIVGRQHLAEDVLQETFTAAWKLRERFDARRGTEVSWLLGIARSRALDTLRADGNRLRYEGEATSEAPAMPAREGHDFLARAKLQAALLALPDGQRACIDLAYFGGMTQSEIALNTGMPLGSVKANVRRGLEKLAEWFSDDIAHAAPAAGQTQPPLQAPATSTDVSADSARLQAGSTEAGPAALRLTVVAAEVPSRPTVFGRPEELKTTVNATLRPRQSG